MINVKEYSGHIRNWSALCERLGIDHSLSREDREAQILIKAYETWGNEMGCLPLPCGMMRNRNYSV